MTAPPATADPVLDRVPDGFTDLFGDELAVGIGQYSGHPEVGDARGVSLHDADGNVTLVFSPAEAWKLGSAIREAARDAMRAERIKNPLPCEGCGKALPADRIGFCDECVSAASEVF